MDDLAIDIVNKCDMKWVRQVYFRSASMTHGGVGCCEWLIGDFPAVQKNVWIWQELRRGRQEGEGFKLHSRECSFSIRIFQFKRIATICGCHSFAFRKLTRDSLFLGEIRALCMTKKYYPQVGISCWDLYSILSCHQTFLFQRNLWRNMDQDSLCACTSSKNSSQENIVARLNIFMY